MDIRRYGLVAACLSLVFLLPAQSAGKAVGPKPGRMVLNYDAGLAGINLGDFKVIADFNGTAYDMRAHGEFSLLAGIAFKATGESASNGRLVAGNLQPAQYSMKYVGSKKAERRRIDFNGGAVSKVSIVPQKAKRDPRNVPLTSAQLRNVLDPLTAAFLSVRSNAPSGDKSVCNRTIPVFEGRQRFDIKLSPKRTETLGRRAPRAFGGRAAVCRVRYVPVSGHRPDHAGVQYMKKNEGIEVWLVPLPQLGLYVPYKILIPTAWGTGSITLDGVKQTNQVQRAGAP